MDKLLAQNHPFVVQQGEDVAAAVRKALAKGLGSGQDSSVVNPLESAVLEIEGSFGSVDRVTGAFVQNLDTLSAQRIMTALDRGRTEWEHVDDEWSLVHDSYVTIPETGESVRARSVNGKPHSNITKNLVCRADFETVAPEVDFRLNVKLERPLQPHHRNKVIVLTPDSVRVSVRRRFTYRSKSLPYLEWHYDVYRSWLAKTVEEAERAMRDPDVTEKTARTTVEVETELKWNGLDPDLVQIACTSLILKIQDLLAVCTHDRSMRRISLYQPRKILPELKVQVTSADNTKRIKKRQMGGAIPLS